MLAPVQARSGNRPAGPTAIRHITLLTNALATGRNPSPPDGDPQILLSMQRDTGDGSSISRSSTLFVLGAVVFQTSILRPKANTSMPHSQLVINGNVACQISASGCFESALRSLSMEPIRSRRVRNLGPRGGALDSEEFRLSFFRHSAKFSVQQLPFLLVSGVCLNW